MRQWEMTTGRMLGSAAMLLASGCISDLVNIGDGPGSRGGRGGTATASGGSMSGEL